MCFYTQIRISTVKYTAIFSGKLQGRIQLPASKSISNRALILNALSNHACNIRNLSDCDDTQVMQQAFTSGKNNIDIRAAGTSMRFLTAYLAQKEGEWVITGSERMKNRPIRILVEALNKLGANIEYLEKTGFPPLKISGKKLQGGNIILDGSVSSQFISALMMIAPSMQEGLTLNLTGEIISKPYIRMTIRMMRDFGIHTDWNGNTIHIEPQVYIPYNYNVENDWSAASYWYEMVALSPEGTEIELPGLFEDSIQGDAGVSGLFKLLGVETRFKKGAVTLFHKESGALTACFQYDFINEPDLAQTFVVTCALKNIPFHFKGLQSLRIKETDRLHALQQEMKKLGYMIDSVNDSELIWSSERCEPLPEAVIETYEDHRMAMAFAPAAIITGKINIRQPLVVTKSYPSFWENLETAGFEIKSSENDGKL